MEPSQDLLLSPGQLKRIKVFADLTDEQIAIFVGLVEAVQIKPNRLIVKMGDMGDGMYLLLNGEVRVSQTVEGRETILAVLEKGDFFGEVCLFDQGPRAADVVANQDCTLLKISKTAFEGILASRPDVTARFLLALLRTVAGRLRHLDRKYIDSMLLSRFWNRAGSDPASPPPPKRPL